MAAIKPVLLTVEIRGDAYPHNIRYERITGNHARPQERWNAKDDSVARVEGISIPDISADVVTSLVCAQTFVNNARR